MNPTDAGLSRLHGSVSNQDASVWPGSGEADAGDSATADVETPAEDDTGDGTLTDGGAAVELDASQEADAAQPLEDAGSELDASQELDAAQPLEDAGVAAGADAGFDPSRSLFAGAYGVITRRCAFCHVTGGIGWWWGHLDLSSPALAHGSLVSRLASGMDCGGTGAVLVKPGDADGSLLVQKVERTQHCGVAMPDKYPPLEASDIALLRAWIDAGAPYDMPGTPVQPSDPPAGTYPEKLSATGLFSDFAARALAPGVRAYEPRYTLWSDGVVKRRWLYLPPGTRIDTSDMDYWVYPVGTKVWKEFMQGEQRLETRMLHKVASDRWVMISYAWKRDQSDALAAPEGVSGVNGTQHDAPDQRTCHACHDNMKDKLLGVSALQLSHELPGVTLAQLAAEGRLTHAPERPYELPGDAVAQQALGLLHANCGHCHNPSSGVYRGMLGRPLGTGGPDLWERTGMLGSVEATIGYRSTVGRANAILPSLHIIEAGDPDASELVLRMRERGLGSLQMPPIGTNRVDTTGLEQVRAFIRSLAQ